MFSILLLFLFALYPCFAASPSPSPRNAIPQKQTLELWPNGEIPYTFEKSLPPTDPLRRTLQKALQHYQENLQGVLQFKDCGKCRSLDNYLILAKRKTCFTETVGKKKKGPQVLAMNNSCNFIGVAIHHLGHVLGLYHQHQRRDRDEFLQMNPQFFPQGITDPALYPIYSQAFGIYDEESVMHFSSWPELGQKTSLRRQGPVFLKKADQTAVKGGWPWSPQGTTLKDRSALWELYATLWGWEPFSKGPLLMNSSPVRLLGTPAIISQKPGEWDLWMRGHDNYLYHRQLRKVWSPWKRLGTTVLASSDPVALLTGEGQMEVFLTDSDHQVTHLSYDEKKGGWGKSPFQWKKIPGPPTYSRPTVTLRPNGAWELYIRGTELNIYRNSFSAKEGWMGWEDLGGQATASPAVVVSPEEDRIDLLVPDLYGKVWRKVWQEGKWWPSPLEWSREGMDDFKVSPEKVSKSQYNSHTPLAVTSCPQGHMAILARGPKGILFTKFWYGKWGDWVPIGGILKSAPAAYCDSEGVLHVWAQGEDKELWHRKFILE